LATVDLRQLDRREMEHLLQEMGHPPYRGRQLFRWVHNRGIASIEVITDLPKELRGQIAQQSEIRVPAVVGLETSRDNRTRKMVLKLPDGEMVEMVVMEYLGRDSRDRITLCLSTQAGCAMGCLFCATGMGGFRRNLTTGEIISQVLAGQKLVAVSGYRISNVVYMGMGEPLLNYQAVLKSIHILNDENGLGISYRRITLSTCGLVPEIRRLAGERLPIVLAVSLHAPNDHLRDRLMPINRKYPLVELMAACRDYIWQTGRRITFEYALARGVNDSMVHARQLAELVAGMKVNINLIPLNPVAGAGLRPSPRGQVQEFASYLLKYGTEVSIREEMGGDIQAACGQLRRRVLAGTTEQAGEKGVKNAGRRAVPHRLGQA